MRTINSAAVAVILTVGLLLTSTATAWTVILDPGNSAKAIGITDLEIASTFYNVTFLEQKTAQEVYGGPPGVYPFGKGDINSAIEAVRAVNAALNAEPASIFWVGSEGGAADETTEFYLLGYDDSSIIGPTILDAIEGENFFKDAWRDNLPIDIPAYSIDRKTFAAFAVVPIPATVWLFGSALGLLGWIRRRTA